MATETWVLNENVTCFPVNQGYNISFTCDGVSYSWFGGKKTSGFAPDMIVYDNTIVNSGSAWYDQKYRTITFNELPSEGLLTWLEANGTKQAAPTISFKHRFKNDTLIGTGTYKFRRYSVEEPTPTPTGETWLLNSTLSTDTFSYTVNFTSKGTDFTLMKREYRSFLGEVQENRLSYNTTVVYDPTSPLYSPWPDEAYRTITFSESPTGDLLTWLQANGTKQGGVTPKGYKLTLTTLYLNAGQTVSIHMNNADGTSTVASTLSANMSWENVVSFWITDSYGGSQFISINGSNGSGYSATNPYVLTQDTTLTYDNSCLTYDMLVTLSDGSEKQICDLTSDDAYVVYDFTDGSLVAASAKYFDAVNGHSGKFAGQYQKYTFEDGTVIKEVHKHRFLNLTRMEFINLCHWNIGDRIYKMDGTTPALVSREIVTGTVEHFTVTTEKYHNGFVQGCLYGDRYAQRYEIQMVDGKPKYDFNKPHTVDYVYGELEYED
nr:MAG TPA: Protein hedgehog autoprocessing doamin, SIGNALING PROTEIN.36A [Caudoviricetes sp.]